MATTNRSMNAGPLHSSAIKLAALAALAGSSMAMAQGTLVPIPPHSSTYNGFSRGYNFTAQVPFIISRLELPPEAMQAGDTGSFLIRVNGAVAHREVGVAGAFITPDIPIQAGDVVDIIGNWSPAVTGNFTAHNSYAVSGVINTTIEGVAHQLTRTGWQWDIGDPNWQSAAYLAPTAGQPGRILMYTLPASNDPAGCCFSDGSCQFITPTECANLGGAFRGLGSDCTTACPQPGACCRFDGTCTIELENACASAGGTYQGAGSVCGNCPGIPGVVYTNCNLTTGTTTLNGVAAPSGAEWSECAQDEFDPTIANTTAGFSVSGAFRLADDFAVPAGGMDLAFLKIPAYTTGATTLTATGATLQIWDGPPGDVNSNIIFGDTTTNRMAHVEWSDVYRTFNTVTPAICGGALTAPGTTRRQQWVYIAVNQNLSEGTYWLDWNVTGAAFAPSTTSPDAIGRQCDPNNSNGLQFNVTWVPANDAGQGCLATPVQQDHYFELLGDTGAQCYANCDGSTVEPILNVDDFTCFINEFAAAQALPHEQQVASYPNCDGSTVAPALNVDDFTCFINEFAAGCN